MRIEDELRSITRKCCTKPIAPADMNALMQRAADEIDRLDDLIRRWRAMLDGVPMRDATDATRFSPAFEATREMDRYMKGEQRMPEISLFMGWDPREEEAFAVGYGSALKMAAAPIHGHELHLSDLLLRGVTRRALVRNGKHRLWDIPSQAPCATEFALTRFLIGKIAHPTGWAIFTDCDVVFLAPPDELLALADDRFALMCVKHDLSTDDYPASSIAKMDGQVQTEYARKNWSSVMLWNLAHPAHERLTDYMLEWMPGRDLHRFCWLEDQEIGALPPAWNWLVGVQPMPLAPKLAHFTLGGPWLPGWEPRQHDDIWLAARKALGS